MTYSNSFVLAIKDQNGNVLRESGGNVYLPYHSEYSLLLKNNGPQRATATVKIDGTDVLGGREIIIPTYGNLSLERFLVDGNLSSGKRFKFVPLTDSRVQDPSSVDNGLVEVTFWREVPYTICSSPTYYPSSGTPAYDYGSIGGQAMYSCSASLLRGSNAGATVEGSSSNQKFQETAGFVKESWSTTLKLRILASEVPVTVKETRTLHCTGCGRKVKFADNYCGSCGRKVDR